MLQGQKLLKQCLRAWREDVAASKESSSSGENTDGPVEDAMRVMRARKQPVSGQPLWEQVREQEELSARREAQIITLTNELTVRDKLIEGLRAENDDLFVVNEDLSTRLRLNMRPDQELLEKTMAVVGAHAQAQIDDLNAQVESLKEQREIDQDKIFQLETATENGTLHKLQLHKPSYEALDKENQTLRYLVQQLHKEHAEEIAKLRESLSGNEQYERYESDMMYKNKQIQDLITTLEETQRAKNASDELFAALKRECDAVKEQLTAMQSAASAGPSPPPAASSLPPAVSSPAASSPAASSPAAGGPPPPPPPPTKAKMEEASANQAKNRVDAEKLKVAEQVEKDKKDKMDAAKQRLPQGMTGDHDAALRAVLAKRRAAVADADN